MIESITEWLKGLLVAGTMSNLTGLFDSINEEVEDIAPRSDRRRQAGTAASIQMYRRIS